jgi:hypothetical protein
LKLRDCRTSSAATILPTEAVAAAILDATGVWLTELTMTPERVMTAIAGGARSFAISYGALFVNTF